MSITPGHLVLNTLQDLSRAVSRAGARDPSKDFTRVIPNPSKAYALGGLGIATIGRSAPAPLRYDSITLASSSTPALLGMSKGVHQAVGRAYDNPGVRFGDRSRGSARPLSAEGGQTFHFSHTYISKSSSILEMVKADQRGRRYSGSKATDHLLYIERDGAAEKVAREKEYPGYDADVAEDGFDRLEREAAGRSAETQQDYLERPGAVERTPRANLSDDELDALEYASFGTIGDTIEERRHFWAAVEQFERTPKGDSITVRFADHPEWWELALSNRATAPAPVRAALEIQAKRREPADIDLREISTDQAFAIYKWASTLYPEAPIDIEPGRGGRIQNRVIAELPFELEGRERLEIVRDFTNKLAERNFPFWAVIHAPDQNNDARNFHVHIIYYDRPATRMKDPKNPNGPELWDFEIKEEKVYKNYTRRVITPYAHDKPRDVNGRDWIPKLREHWEQVSNKIMEKAGVIKRYDARSYEAMGIQLDPLKHIPSKTFNKERKGDLTEDGVVLARRQWQVMQDRLVADHRKRAEHRHRKLKEKTDKARQVMGSQSPYKDIALKEVDRLAHIIERLGNRVSVKELFQDLTRLVVDRVASRPKLIIDADKKKNEKSPGRTKSKSGQGHGQNPQAPEDKNGATQPVGRAAKDAMTFLVEVFGHALQMDRRTGAEVQVARSQLTALLKRLDNMMADPKRHPLDRRSPGFIDLNVIDPGPEVIAARKQERMERITNSLNAYVEAAVPKILAEVTGKAPPNPEPGRENIPQAPLPSQASPARTVSASREPIVVNREAAKAPIDRSASDRPSAATGTGAQPAPATTVQAAPVQKPVPARLEERVARPPRTRYRPEPIYKPKEKADASAAATAKNIPASPIKSPAPANSVPTAPAQNNSRAEAANKPVVTENSGQPLKPTANSAPKPENAALGAKLARDNSGATAAKPAAASPTPSPAQGQRPAAAPTNAKPAQVQAPSRPSQAPGAPAQTGSIPKNPATAKVASTPVPAPGKAPTQAPTAAPASRSEPNRVAPRPEIGAGKPDVSKTPAEPGVRAQSERVTVAPKPSPARPGPTRAPGERSGENQAAKPAKEKAEIRVGQPLSPVPTKQIEPIRVEGKKLPKKPKRRGKGRDDGPGL